MEWNKGGRITDEMKNHTWKLVTLPHNKRPNAMKWVNKVTVKLTGAVTKYKTGLICKRDFCKRLV